MSFDIGAAIADQVAACEEGAGVWVPIAVGDNEEAFWIKLKPAQNPAYKEEFRRLTKMNCIRRRKKRFDDLPQDTQERILTEALFGTVVVGWRDLVENGEPLAFNLENFMRIMDNLWDFANQVLLFAGAQETFNKEHQEIVGKNFERPSDGS